jgi:hypothetical protein
MAVLVVSPSPTTLDGHMRHRFHAVGGGGRGAGHLDLSPGPDGAVRRAPEVAVVAAWDQVRARPTASSGGILVAAASGRRQPRAPLRSRPSPSTQQPPMLTAGGVAARSFPRGLLSGAATGRSWHAAPPRILRSPTKPLAAVQPLLRHEPAADAPLPREATRSGAAQPPPRRSPEALSGVFWKWKPPRCVFGSRWGGPARGLLG